MRYNLKVPFAQKDAAKELGARWDAARKLWYVVNPECLEVFSDWAPQAQDAADSAVAASTSAEPRRGTGVVTGPQQVQQLCSCPVLPWQACEHSVLHQ